MPLIMTYHSILKKLSKVVSLFTVFTSAYENEVIFGDDKPSDSVGVYETAEIVIFQSFFDKLSSDFIPPLFSGLDGFVLIDNIPNPD